MSSSKRTASVSLEGSIAKRLKHSASDSIKDANDFLKFVDNSPSPFHAVRETIQRLEKHDFLPLSEIESSWDLKPNGKYYVTRNSSSIIAFAIGGKFSEGNGVTAIGAHTDSPCLKVKPVSKIKKSEYLEVGVECYGGGLWHTWFDRDLSLSGRVIVREDSGFVAKLVSLPDPILRIPTLAIHLQRTVNTDGFKFNNETELVPVIATALKGALGSDKDSSTKEKHHNVLIELLASELECSTDSICDFELCLHDTQPAAVGGAKKEFIFAPRLDNLMMSYTSIQALTSSLETLSEDTNVRMVALYDNEEVGSNSLMGAASTLFESVIERITGKLHFQKSIRKSLMVSADMAHALHPNYASKHEANHQPMMHEGLVIKHNANQRYATTSTTAFILRELAKRHDIPIQDFCVRQDMGCGSTIGPIISTRTGIRTIDVGIPQLSMHSIREMCGTDDVSHSINIFIALFNEFSELDSQLTGSV